MDAYGLLNGLPEDVVSDIRSAVREAQLAPGVRGHAESLIASRDGEVRVGMVQVPPLAEGSEPKNTFFGEVAERVIGCINPEWTVKSEMKEEIDLLTDGLKNCKYDLLLGVFDMVCRRQEGLDFVHLPGWRLRLSGVCTWPQQSDSEQRPSWENLVASENRPNYVPMVIKGEAGYLYLKGPCRYPQDDLECVSGVFDPRVLADKYDAATKQHPTKAVILVADHETCRRVVNCLNEGRRPALRGSVAFELKNAPDSCPSYRLSIAVRASDRRWRDLIAAAIADELFDNAKIETARLYARYLSRLIVPANVDDQSISSWTILLDDCIHDLPNDLTFRKKLGQALCNYLPENEASRNKLLAALPRAIRILLDRTEPVAAAQQHPAKTTPKKTTGHE
jgi:hypothetical protein